MSYQLIKDVEADLKEVLSWLRVRNYNNAVIAAKNALLRIERANVHADGGQGPGSPSLEERNT